MKTYLFLLLLINSVVLGAEPYCQYADVPMIPDTVLAACRAPLEHPTRGIIFAYDRRKLNPEPALVVTYDNGKCTYRDEVTIRFHFDTGKDMRYTGRCRGGKTASWYIPDSDTAPLAREMRRANRVTIHVEQYEFTVPLKGSAMALREAEAAAKRWFWGF